MRVLRKVVIANRGEIACRVIRACRERGITSVALFSEIDRASLHVRMADEAYPIGPAPARESYLNIERIVEAARRAKADALHPGYGFLSENAEFARACERAGLLFIGPPPEAIEAMGEKTRARARMEESGVPVVPGGLTPAADMAEALAQAERVGYPVMLKAAAGGGGKGMRAIPEAARLPAAFEAARREAQGAFGDDRVYIEKYLEEPRHIELQIFADERGRCIHLNERECSIQRRHQKVIEESPSPLIDESLRERMGAIAVRAAKAVGYVGAGTVEFLVDARKQFYFLEMNTRLQVEHPITEWITGLDLVHWQLEIARGGRLPLPEAPPVRGHAIEARLYAEDPANGFCPSPGRITALDRAGGPWVREDSGVYEGWSVPAEYDPLLSKLSVWAPSRAEAIARLDRALRETRFAGIATNVRWLRHVLTHPDFLSGRYDTGLLSKVGPLPSSDPDTSALDEEALAAAMRGLPSSSKPAPIDGASPWRSWSLR